MATAGDGAAAYEGTGAGGKFRKRTLRRNHQTTPYDRPPTAATGLRNPSWLTKLVVDPASKLITSGAHRFFASIFRKRLPAPPTPLPPPPGPSQESKDLPNESCRNDYAGALVVAGQEGGDAACSSRDGTFSELEYLLKQKTFTRAEIDRLTELLHSKAVDMPMGNEEKRTEAVQSRPVLDFSSSLLEENRHVKVTSGGVVATPVTSSRILEDDIASPAELAKAYMGSRPSKVSPSMLSTRSQVVREDTPLLKNVQYVQKSPIPSVTTKNTGLLGFRGNGFTTPRSRGRSAIYSMARTPYSRVRQTEAQKATSSTNYVYGGTSAQSVSEHDVLFGSNQTLKRRSYVLDDDLGSVGPMRRIRQKPNLLSHGVSRPGAGVASAANLHQEVSKVVGDNEDNKTTPTRHVAVPPKSSETAAKILEHLEKMTPKGKSSESKLVAGKNRIPNKLTPNMLHGRALRSLEDLDSPKLLQSAQDSYKLENWSKVFSPNPRELKKSEIEQNGHKSSVSEPNVIVKNDATFSFKDAQPNAQTDSLDDKSAAQPPLKKRGFRMSALEDSDELEEDISSNGPSCQLAEGRGKLEVYVTDQPRYAAEPTNKPATSLEVRAPLGVLDKKADMENPDTGAITVKDTSSLPNADSRLLNVNPLESASIKSKETNVDKVPPFLFSSSTPFTGSNLESSSSLSNILSSPADARPNPFESSNSQKAVDSNGKLQALSSGPSSSISTKGNFAFGAASSTSSLSNGLSGPSPAISATSPLVPDNFVKDFSNSSPTVAPSVSIGSTIRTTAGSSTVSASSLFGSSAASLVSQEPHTKLGSSEVPPKIFSALSTTSTPETSDMKAKSETGTTFGNLKSSPLPSASVAPAISGSSIFGFSPSVMSGGKESQGSIVSTGGDLLVSAQASVVGSGYSDVSGSMPACFSSSASSPSTGNIPVFGSAPGTTGQVSASPSNSNLVGSSNAACGILSFGANSSAPSAVGSSFGPSNGAVPVTFAFGANSATPASEACAPATSSSVTPGLFNFGGSSSASSTNAVNISSSTTSSMFNFGCNSSSSSTTAISTSAATSVFKFGASTSTSPTIAVSTSTSATPGIFNFGATSASLTNSSSTVNPIPFTFGATSASPQTSTTSGTFGSSWQPAKSPGFSSPFSSSTPVGYTFGASSPSFATPSTSAGVFGSTASASSGSAFLFGSTSSTNSFSQHVFGNSTPSFAATPGNNNNMDDSSMAEDPVQASGPPVPFVQPSVLPSPSDFVFGSTPNPFQFGGQQIQAVPQNSSPFAASGSQDFGAGGSAFSFGSNGPDKSNRRIVKVNRNKNRRK